MLSIAHMWYPPMPCCWASTCPPALMWTHSRHTQLMNHRSLWGHGQQPAARVLCSWLSKAKCLALLSFKQLELNMSSLSLSARSSILLVVCESILLHFFLEMFLIHFSSSGKFNLIPLHASLSIHASKIKLWDIFCTSGFCLWNAPFSKKVGEHFPSRWHIM